tara:strand:+ start:196 stop:345 length:150 start_codon:yes stop_codon:yes gene_type:complete
MFDSHILDEVHDCETVHAVYRTMGLPLEVIAKKASEWAYDGLGEIETLG